MKKKELIIEFESERERLQNEMKHCKANHKQQIEFMIGSLEMACTLLKDREKIIILYYYQNKLEQINNVFVGYKPITINNISDTNIFNAEIVTEEAKKYFFLYSGVYNAILDKIK